MRIFICDDDAAFCALVGIWLEDRDDVEVVGTATTEGEARAGLGAMEVDVVLLDTMDRLPTGLGVEDVRELAPDADVILYSGHPAEIAARMVGGEADMYLLKGSTPAHLLDAIDDLGHGRAQRRSSA